VGAFAASVSRQRVRHVGFTWICGRVLLRNDIDDGRERSVQGNIILEPAQAEPACGVLVKLPL